MTFCLRNWMKGKDPILDAYLFICFFTFVSYFTIFTCQWVLLYSFHLTCLHYIGDSDTNLRGKYSKGNTCSSDCLPELKLTYMLTGIFLLSLPPQIVTIITIPRQKQRLPHTQGNPRTDIEPDATTLSPPGSLYPEETPADMPAPRAASLLPSHGRETWMKLLVLRQSEKRIMKHNHGKTASDCERKKMQCSRYLSSDRNGKWGHRDRSEGEYLHYGTHVQPQSFAIARARSQNCKQQDLGKQGLRLGGAAISGRKQAAGFTRIASLLGEVHEYLHCVSAIWWSGTCFNWKCRFRNLRTWIVPNPESLE